MKRKNLPSTMLRVDVESTSTSKNTPINSVTNGSKMEKMKCKSKSQDKKSVDFYNSIFPKYDREDPKDKVDDGEDEPEIVGVGVRSKNKKHHEVGAPDDLEIKEEVKIQWDSDQELKPDMNDSKTIIVKETEDLAKEEIDESRTAIRKELGNLTFEELEVLKNEMGTKQYNEAMFGSQAKKLGTRKKKFFKRENKNRPRELPARVHVPRVREVVHVKKVIRRDPRYEESCGELDPKIWDKNYDFLKEIQQQEAKELEKSLKSEQNEERKEEIRQYLQKLKNKERSNAVNEQHRQKRKELTQENKKRVEEGKNPFYMKKSTQKLMDLAEKYEELKSTGRLEKYLKKKRKKNLIRDKKALKLPKE